MDEKLIEKCMLTPDEMLAAEIEGGSEVSGYGTGAAEHRHAENRGISRATVAKAIPIIRREILREVGEWLARYYDVTSPSELKRALKEGRLPGEK